MRLAFCLFKYFPFGGLQRDFIRIVRECLRRGHQVDVFTMAWEGEIEPHLSIHIIPVSGLQNHVRAAQFVEKIQHRLKAYDVVIGFNRMPGLDVYYAADVCYQAKARQQHGLWYRLMPRYRHWASYEKSVFSFDSRTHILLLSSAQQIAFMDFYQTPASRFHLLPPGIARDRVVPFNADKIRQEWREQCGLLAHERLVLFVGSGFKTKGLDRVLRSVASLPRSLQNKTHLYIIGKDDESLFQKQANRLKIASRVKFLGGRHDVPLFLLAADVLFHPAYHENTGTVLLEALASGLPVLTTDSCGYAHYVTDASAGRVLPSPFKQMDCDQALQDMLSSTEHSSWKENAISFAHQADIYSLPERAVDCIESLFQ